MATFNSAQNGNWNTDATWAEAGHPTANDDVTIITHDVTYDVGVSAITWGSCTINSGGILIFPINANSKMLFNDAKILTINNGGELRAGTNGAPIGSGFLCQIHWPQGAAARYPLVLNAGGKIDVYGDPAYYGSAKTAILDSQWAAGGGLTLYVEGDYSAKWAAGQHFIIHDFAQYVNYATDAESFEISSVGAYDVGNDRTPIVVTAAGDSDTFLVGAKLWMLSRNVEFFDKDSSWAVNNFASHTERVSFDNNQALGGTSIHFEETIFRGFGYVSFYGYGLECDATVFLNCANVTYTTHEVRMENSCLVASCNYGFYNSTKMQLDLDIVACNIGLYDGHSVSMGGDCFSCYAAIYQVDSIDITGNMYSCRTSLSGGADIKMMGNIEKGTFGISGPDNTLFIGDIKDCSSSGVNAGSSLSLIGDITGCGKGVDALEGTFKFKNGQLSGNTADISGIATASDLRAAIFEDYTIGGTKRELEIYANAGNILCFHNGDAHWQAPPSGESFILEMLPNTNCSTYRNGWLSLTPDPLNLMFAYTTAGAKTLTFKIYPVGWASSLDQDDIQLEVFYLAGAGVGRTRIVNTTETYANAGWRNMTVSFTPGQNGIVYFAIHLKKYEAGDYVLIDPQWAIS